MWSEAPSVYGTSGNNVTVLMDNASQSGYAKSGDYTQSDSYHFPQVYSEHETGALHASNPSGQYVDGGHDFYATIWVDLAKYPVNYQSTAMGVNEVSVDLQDSWNIYAQMFLTMDSETNKANPGVTNAADKYDEILFEPVDTTNPFPNGVPAGWSNADVQALKSEKPFN
ncbi:hypothetical protein [Sporolactobacillus pectinivorans]|uniref:hypothetical protein n=1 Tax=Sporolactobacillus pectinivorans TaxID=1591408 RepID=UPI0012FD6D88|nr:hypothetical protein [Sporolactobacillus pectinivorans]